MRVKHFSIKPFSQFPDTYFEAREVGEIDDSYLLAGAGQIFEFGKDHPKWLEDIRGQIEDEPDRVFIELTQDTDNNTVGRYFGVTAIDGN